MTVDDDSSFYDFDAKVFLDFDHDKNKQTSIRQKHESVYTFLKILKP